MLKIAGKSIYIYTILEAIQKYNGLIFQNTVILT